MLHCGVPRHYIRLQGEYKRIVAILVSILFAISERSTLFVFSAIKIFFLFTSLLWGASHKVLGNRDPATPN